MALFGPKTEKVRGRLIVHGAKLAPGAGFSYALTFLRSVAGGHPPPEAPADVAREQVVAECTIITQARTDYEVELTPGYYQLLALVRPCRLESGQLIIEEGEAVERPFPRAFEVGKGRATLLNIQVRPKVGEPPPVVEPPPTAAQLDTALTLVWATDNRLHAQQCAAMPDLGRRLAQIPPQARQAFEHAVHLSNSDDATGALRAYEAALVSVPDYLRATVREFVLDVELGRAKSFVALKRHGDACRVLGQYLAPGRPLRAIPAYLAVDVLGTFGEALGSVGHPDQLDRCITLALELAKTGGDAAKQAALTARVRSLIVLDATVAPARALELLDMQSALTGPPEADVHAARFRVVALAKLGRLGAARIFGRDVFTQLKRTGADELAAALERVLNRLPSGAGTDPSPAVRSSALEVRAAFRETGAQLVAAATRGDQATVARLGRGPRGLDAADERGTTALMAAASQGFEELVTWLLDGGAQLEATNELSRSAMMFATERGHASLVRFMLEKGAVRDRQDHALRTPLHLAAQNNHLPVVRVLLEHQASVTTRDADDRTPLLLACTSDVPEVATVLIQGGADANEMTDEGVTPLMVAAASGHPRVVRVLLRDGADPAAQDARGLSAREWAEKHQHEAVVRVLSE